MSIEAEFIVNLGPYEHVKISVSAESFGGLADQMDHLAKGEVAENFGDWHACLKAAVLYGRDQAFTGATSAPLDPILPVIEDDPETSHEGAVEALKEELGATVLAEEEKHSEAPSSPSLGDLFKPEGAAENPLAEVFKDSKPKRPWDKKPAAKKAVAPKPQPKSKTESDWDF